MASYKLPSNAAASEFPVWCSFVDNYIAAANPIYVVVYLYGLRQCFSPLPKCDVASCAEALSILETDVVKSWKYWESVGLVRLTYVNASDPTAFDIEFVDLSRPQIVAQQLSSRPAYTMREIAQQMKEDAALKSMYDYAQSLLGKTLTQTDAITLFGFYDWLGLPVEVILTIIEHCVDLGHKSMRYIEKVALSWADLGIDSMEKAQNHLSARESMKKEKRKYKKLLNLGDRELSDAEYAHIVEWTKTLGLSDELIRSAYEKTVMNTGKVSFPYMNTILRNWYENGIKTPEQAEKEKKIQPKPKAAVRNKFGNYTQTGDYDIESIEKLAMKELTGE